MTGNEKPVTYPAKGVDSFNVKNNAEIGSVLMRRQNVVSEHAALPNGRPTVRSVSLNDKRTKTHVNRPLSVNSCSGADSPLNDWNRELNEFCRTLRRRRRHHHLFDWCVREGIIESHDSLDTVLSIILKKTSNESVLSSAEKRFSGGSASSIVESVSDVAYEDMACTILEDDDEEENYQSIDDDVIGGIQDPRIPARFNDRKDCEHFEPRATMPNEPNTSSPLSFPPQLTTCLSNSETTAAKRLGRQSSLPVWGVPDVTLGSPRDFPETSPDEAGMSTFTPKAYFRSVCKNLLRRAETCPERENPNDENGPPAYEIQLDDVIGLRRIEDVSSCSESEEQNGECGPGAPKLKNIVQLAMVLHRLNVPSHFWPRVASKSQNNSDDGENDNMTTSAKISQKDGR